MLRTVCGLSDCELPTIRRVELLDQIAAREGLGLEILLGRLYSLSIPILVEAAHSDSRIVDRELPTIRRVELVNKTLS